MAPSVSANVAMGRFRPIRPVLPASSCLLRPERGPEPGVRQAEGALRLAASLRVRLPNRESFERVRYELTDHECTAISAPGFGRGVMRRADGAAAMSGGVQIHEFSIVPTLSRPCTHKARPMSASIRKPTNCRVAAKRRDGPRADITSGVALLNDRLARCCAGRNQPFTFRTDEMPLNNAAKVAPSDYGRGVVLRVHPTLLSFSGALS